jgi:hypothetical protein
MAHHRYNRVVPAGNTQVFVSPSTPHKHTTSKHLAIMRCPSETHLLKNGSLKGWVQKTRRNGVAVTKRRCEALLVTTTVAPHTHTHIHIHIHPCARKISGSCSDRHRSAHAALTRVAGMNTSCTGRPVTVASLSINGVVTVSLCSMYSGSEVTVASMFGSMGRLFGFGIMYSTAVHNKTLKLLMGLQRPWHNNRTVVRFIRSRQSPRTSVCRVQVHDLNAAAAAHRLIHAHEQRLRGHNRC